MSDITSEKERQIILANLYRLQQIEQAAKALLDSCTPSRFRTWVYVPKEKWDDLAALCGENDPQVKELKNG